MESTIVMRRCFLNLKIIAKIEVKKELFKAKKRYYNYFKN
jgi:hypothetical protein